MRTSGTQATIRLVRLLEMTGRHYKTLSLSVKIQTQITKRGVHRTDKRKLFLSSPGLNLFFSRDGISHVTVSLEIHQPGHAVSFCKSRHPFFFMLSDAAFEVVGDPYVEDASRACQDIDVVDHDGLDFATCKKPCHSERSDTAPPPVIPSTARNPGYALTSPSPMR